MFHAVEVLEAEDGVDVGVVAGVHVDLEGVLLVADTPVQFPVFQPFRHALLTVEQMPQQLSFVYCFVVNVRTAPLRGFKYCNSGN